jgi:hypothetical protein
VLKLQKLQLKFAGRKCGERGRANWRWVREELAQAARLDCGLKQQGLNHAEGKWWQYAVRGCRFISVLKRVLSAGGCSKVTCSRNLYNKRTVGSFFVLQLLARF